MATWKTENSMLTQVGIEMLNKIKAGTGAITVTRVVAGSGRVASSLLSSQTTVSGTQKTMNLVKKRPYSKGSEITVQISNNNFAAEFPLNQIGIFVTHPDYSGEHLYHISQCEESGYDKIPASSDGTSTFEYTLFLEHSNSGSATIVIDPAGLISTQEFNYFIAGTVPEELFVIGEEGTLKSTGKTVKDFYNRNLLNNWDFTNPVNTKSGRLVPGGTTYYSNTALTTVAGTTSDFMEVTYVNNTYSTLVVNNVTYYVRNASTTQGYVSNGNNKIALDRWRLTSFYGASALMHDSTSVMLYLKPGAALSQNIGNKIPPESLRGRTLTVSVNVLAYQGGTPVVDIVTGSDGITLPITKNGINSLTFVVPEDTDTFEIRIGNSHASNQCLLELLSVKVELGSVSTLENDLPADYAEQMAICIQYDPNTDEYKGFVINTNTALAEASVVS